MERLFALARLLDYYGALLTERQKALMAQYVYEDLSLGEIAEREGISRQAVRDAIVHSESQLRTYEDRLHLIRQGDALAKACGRMVEAIDLLALPEGEKAQLRRLADEIRQKAEDDDGI